MSRGDPQQQTKDGPLAPSHLVIFSDSWNSLGMALGQDSPVGHDEPCFSHSAFGLDLFSFQLGQHIVPEGVAAFALQLELPVRGD